MNKRKAELLAGMSATTLALAAAYVGPAGAAETAGAQLEEIVVTAQRREETASKTPLAITAVSAEELKKAAVVNVVQLQYVAPSMQVTQTGQGVYVAIRGVTTTDQTSKGEPGIQFNTDGVPVSRAEEQALGIFDVQRVEVLSGPQGTLYGKSSTGGAINVITAAPGHEQDGAATVELGNYNAKRFNAFWNQPLGDNWAMRIAGSANQRSGYSKLVPNTYSKPAPSDEGNQVGRFSLMGNLSDGVKVRLTGTAGKIDQVGNSGSNINIDSNNFVQASLVLYGNQYNSFQHDHFQRALGQLDADMGAAHLTYTGSRSHYTENLQQASGTFGGGGSQNGPGGFRQLNNNTYDVDYHELRLSNRDPGRLDWVGGANYFKEEANENGHGWFVASPNPSVNCSTNLSGPPPFPFAKDPYCLYTANGGDPAFANQFHLINVTSHKSYGVFLHGVYELVPDWHLTVGVREGSDEIKRVGTIAIVANTVNSNGTLCINGQNCYPNPLWTPPTFSGPGGVNSGANKTSKFVWNVGLDHQFTPTQFGYVRVATGYKAGGFNDQDPTANNSFKGYAPEEMISYEAGYKVHSSAVDFTSSLYFYDYSSNQIQGNLVPADGVLPQFAYVFGAKTQIYGWENSLKWALGENDLLTAGATWADSKFNQALSVGTTQLQGKELNLIPKYTVSLGYTHTIQLGDGSALAFHADSRASDSYYLTNFNSGIRFQQKAYTRSNANVSYTSSSGKLETTLFVTNIENKLQVTSANGFGTGGVPSSITYGGYTFQGNGNVSQPRFWGIRETVKF